MAESILKLKVDSQEYDNKIKRAQQGLQTLETKVRDMGATFEYAEKEDVAFVRSLGKMETVSKSTKGRLNELTNAFVELSGQYNRMTEAEKKSPFGQAMAKSLGELKARINAGSQELKNINGELKKNEGALDTLAKKYTGVGVESLGKFSLATAAAGASLKVAKDAFFASEKNLDDWDRAVYGAQSTYEGFLTSINTGDISGFLTRIGQISSAARTAYDDMDRLGTQKAINNASYQQQNTENERMRAMLRTGRYIAPNDGRTGSMENGAVLTKDQLAGIAKQLENGMSKTNEIIASEIQTTTNAISSLYNEQAAVLGISKKTFMESTSTMENFDRAIEGYNNWKKFEAEHTTTVTSATSFGSVSQNVRDSAVNPYEQYRWAGVFKDDGKLFTKINELINNRAALQTQNYSNTAAGFKAIAKAEGGGAAGGGSVSGGVTNSVDSTAVEGTIRYYQEMISQLNKDLGNAVSDDVRSQINAQIAYAKDQVRGMSEATQGSGIDLSGVSKISLSSGVSVADNLKMDAANMDTSNLQKAGEDWKNYTNNLKIANDENNKARTAIGAIGQALQTIDNPAAKVLGIVAEAIATVSASFASALAQDKTSKGNIYAWIAAAAAGTGTMIATIASIKSATRYAEGGLISGNRYSTDAQYARVNAGELILNRAQQGNLASQLQGNANDRMMQPYVNSETIYVGLNNYLMRSGKGVLVTSH